jgi:hypothetical protein
MFLHLRLFDKFKFSNFKNSNVLYIDKSNSNKKWFNYKVLYLLKMNNFYFGHLVIRRSGSNILHKFIHLSYSFMKLYQRDMFVNKITTILSNEETTQIKIVHLEKYKAL